MIVAIDAQNAIGNRGDQLIYISNDLKHFKSVTTGKTIIMGRKTSDALPKKTLPNRRNIIVTRRHDLSIDGAEIATSPGEALSLCQHDDEVIVIGGGELYNLFMPMAERLYVTHIHHTFLPVDTYFPTIDLALWQAAETSATFTDEKSGVAYHYVVYERVK